MSSLNDALANVDKTYKDLIVVADKIVAPYVKEVNEIIQYATDNVERLTLDDVRNLMLKLALKSYSFSEIKEKSGLKLACAEALKDELYAKTFNSAEGSVAVRENIALLESSYETLTQAIYNEVYSLLKTKLDECHRVVGPLQNVLISIMQDIKIATSGITNGGQEE